MGNQQHIIRKLVFELHIGSEENGYSMQEDVSRIYRDHIEKELERILDGMSGSNEVISIETLQISLENISEENFEEDFKEQAREKIEDLLGQVIAAARGGDRNAGSVNDDKANVTITPASKSNMELLLHFMRTGTLPWRAKSDTSSLTDILGQLIEEAPGQLIAELRKLFSKDNYRKRFIYQFRDDLIARVLKIADSEYGTFSASILHDIIAVNNSSNFTGINASSLRLKGWNYFLERFAERRTDAAGSSKAIILTGLVDHISPGKETYLFLAKKTRQLEKKDHAFATPKFAELVMAAQKAKVPPGETRSAGEEGTAADTSGKKKKTKAKRLKKKDTGKKTGEEKNLPEDIPTSENEEDDLLSLSDQEKKKKTVREGQEPGTGDEENSLLPGKSKKRLSAKERKKIEKEARTKARKERLKRKRTRQDENPGPDPSNDVSSSDVSPDVNDEEKSIGLKDEANIEHGKKAREKKAADEKLAMKQREKELAEQREAMLKAFDNDDEDISALLDDGIYIDNAGLVLLWPYFTAFFTKLGLVENNAFVSIDASHRAVHLLQYLVTGNEEAEPEHELLLNKILCGIDPAEPVSSDFIPTTAEKEECEQLLTAVIDNWSALKKISVHALRSTFIVKEGILRKDTGNWILDIERQTIDLLIDKLPWGISIIKMPWNKELVYVNW